MTHFYEVDFATPPSRPRPHGDLCTWECHELSRHCHLGRSRRKPAAPEVPCPHCGAVVGQPCRALTRSRGPLLQSRAECHPSRLEAAA